MHTPLSPAHTPGLPLTMHVFAGAAADGGEPPPEAGRIRLEFTSAAKPALITWASNDADGPAGETAGDTAGGGGRDGPPAFRYLVVPLRVPVRA